MCQTCVRTVSTSALPSTTAGWPCPTGGANTGGAVGGAGVAGGGAGGDDEVWISRLSPGRTGSVIIPN